MSARERTLGLTGLGTGITPLRDGHAVSRLSDLIIYSVEAGAIGAVVREYGPSTKVGATVAGQTSVKAPEKDAFEKYLPQDVDIVSVHSLHGPGVTTEGQPLVSRAVRAARRPSALGLTFGRSSFTIEGRRKKFDWWRTSSAASKAVMSTSHTKSTTRSPQIRRLSPMPRSSGA